MSSARIRPKSVLFFAALAATSLARADLTTYGDVAVVELGGNTDVAEPISIVEYNVLTGQKVGVNHPLPSTGLTAITLGGLGSHDGHLTLSSDGRYLLLGGVRADAGAASPVTSYNAATNTDTYTKVIGRVDANWSADTSTTLEPTAYFRTELTAVASSDGQSFYTIGSGSYDNPADVANNFSTPTITGGLRYVASLGATSSTNIGQTQAVTTDANGMALSPQPDSYRSGKIVNKQLYLNTASQGSFVNRGLFKTSDALPTTSPQTLQPVIVDTEGSGSDPTGKNFPKTDVVLLDLSPAVPGYDTAYSTGGKADYEKFSLVNGTWVQTSVKTLKSTLTSSPSIDAMDAVVNGTTVTLLATTDGGIFKLTDTAGYNADFSSTFPTTPFILADSGSEFRGIVALPEPTGMLAVAGAIGTVLVRRRRR